MTEFAEIACGTADGAWHADNVSIGCTASDATSGLANSADANFSLITTAGDGVETSSAPTGSRTVADNAGNSATAGPIGSNKIDRKAPVLTLTCPANPVILNSPTAAAHWTATDGGSGVTPAGDVALVTSSIGSHEANVTVQDGVGNSSTDSCDYMVAYTFAGFFAPVDRPNTMNVSKAGQAIPLKWRLTDALNRPITDLTGVTVKAVGMNCDGSGSLDPIEEYATASTSGLLNLEMATTSTTGRRRPTLQAPARASRWCLEAAPSVMSRGRAPSSASRSSRPCHHEQSEGGHG